MIRRVRISLIISLILTFITLLPLILFGLGLLLNILFNCDIRDESGIVYGTCNATLGDFVSILMMMPWIMLITMPFIGVPALLGFIVTAGLYFHHRLR